MEHEGFNKSRLNREPLEKLFADAWADAAPRILEYLFTHTNEKADADVTERDAMVAATVIQWLGSPVGQSFVRDVLEKAHEEGIHNHIEGQFSRL